MAKPKRTPREKHPALNYKAEIKKLHASGPRRVYILRGDEDYLRDRYLDELKGMCLVEGTEAFNYHRLQGPAIDLDELAGSVEAMPFMGERTFTEVRDFDVNKVSAYDPAALKALLADVPDWATLAFVFAPDYEPKGNLTAVTAMRKYGVELFFTNQDIAPLTEWVAKRAADLGKTIDPATARHLIRTCGVGMSGLIPEIVKVAGHAAGPAITRADIDAVAKKAPETTVYDLTSALGAGRFDEAASLLADLLADKDKNAPLWQIKTVGEQFRYLYVTRLAMDYKKDTDFIFDCCPELARRRFLLPELRQTCQQFTPERLARAVSLCAQYEYRMKDTGGDKETLMKELLLRLALDAPC